MSDDDRKRVAAFLRETLSDEELLDMFIRSRAPQVSPAGTGKEFLILKALGNESISIRELAKRLKTRPSSLIRTIQRLRETGKVVMEGERGQARYRTK